MISIANNNVTEFGISSYSVRSMVSRHNNLTPSSTPTLSAKTNNLRSSIELVSSNNSATLEFLELISRVREGLKYHSPELCEEGVNGTYFLKDKNGSKIAVFKPQDEEGESENNPKRNTLSTSSEKLPTKGILPGEAAIREVAAYLLDNEGLYGVPRTQIVKITHNFNQQENTKPTTKTGSLQEFVENDGCSEDFGSRSFPIDEVQKIAILDIQMLNVDRHAGNILVKKSRNNMTLIPIDHGFSLPDNLECSWFEWMNWIQSKMPIDDNLKAYVTRIDIEKNAQLLQKELGVRNECLNMMRISTTLLKRGVELGLTLFEIGSLLCRRSLESPSTLENIFERAKKQDTENEFPESLIEKFIVEEIKSIKQRNLGKSPRLY